MQLVEVQDLRVPSKRVAMVSRKVFWGASNPFITGIFPVWCEILHQTLSRRMVREESAKKGEGERDDGRGGGPGVVMGLIDLSNPYTWFSVPFLRPLQGKYSFLSNTFSFTVSLFQ